MNISIKRVYEDYDKNEGMRILVDRLWPRGLTKEKAGIDFWMKDISPSTELRKWFGHDPNKWNEFKKRYVSELKLNANIVSDLKKKAKKDKITLVYAAKDKEHNEALILKEYLSS